MYTQFREGVGCYHCERESQVSVSSGSTLNESEGIEEESDLGISPQLKHSFVSKTNRTQMLAESLHMVG